MDLALAFIVLGILFLAGLASDELGRRTRLPRVTLLLCCGIAIGNAGLGLIPEPVQAWYEFLAIAALTVVAFLLGNSLTGSKLAAHGRAILSISAAIVIVTMAMVTTGLILLGVAPGVAMILGAIATATAPAATQDTIRQAGGDGPFAETLLGIVAVDDAWALLVFSIALAVAGALYSSGEAGFLSEMIREVGGAILLGLIIGVPAAYLTGRLSPGEPLQTEALGVVFLTAGLSVFFGVSYLISGMVAGAVIANFARHHRQAFHEIEHIQWPFMVLFFLLAGAALELEALMQIGAIGAVYVVLRVVSRLLGGWLGARLAQAPKAQQPWFGVALLPQAGVAVGMALVAGEAFPEWAGLIMSLTIGTTVIFELIGPLATAYALRRVARQDQAEA